MFIVNSPELSTYPKREPRVKGKSRPDVPPVTLSVFPVIRTGEPVSRELIHRGARIVSRGIGLAARIKYAIKNTMMKIIWILLPFEAIIYYIINTFRRQAW
jgi:hypothetical protein